MSNSLAGLPNAQLLQRVRELVRRDNTVEAELLAHLGEVDARTLYLEEGCSSMFSYCQRVLHFEEGVAYKRIQAARASRRYPEILEAVRRGELHLTGVGLLAPRLSTSNSAELIEAARHRTADQIRRVLADREPRPAPPTSVRQIFTPVTSVGKEAVPQVAFPQPSHSVAGPPGTAIASRQPAPERGRTEPLGAERYRVQFTADRETHAQLEDCAR